jgi:PhnB protein
MIAPWLSVSNASRAISFYRDAFGAVEIDRFDDENGDVAVAQLSVADALFWVQQDSECSPTALGGRSPVRMILIVDDPDAFFSRALAAGATMIAALHDAHGWRTGRLVDLERHQWEIARLSVGATSDP